MAPTLNKPPGTPQHPGAGDLGASACLWALVAHSPDTGPGLSVAQMWGPVGVGFQRQKAGKSPQVCLVQQRSSLYPFYSCFTLSLWCFWGVGTVLALTLLAKEGLMPGTRSQMVLAIFCATLKATGLRLSWSEMSPQCTAYSRAPDFGQNGGPCSAALAV